MTNKELIKNYHQAVWDKQNAKVIWQFFHKDAKIFVPNCEEPQRVEDFQITLFELFTGFPNLFVYWDNTSCDSKKILSHWNAQGVHEGPFFKLQPSKKNIRYHGATIYHITKEKISECWSFIDFEKFLTKQIQA